MEELQLCWLVQAGVTSHCLPLLLRRPWIACQPTSIIACSLLKVIIIIATVLCWINDRLYCDVAGIVQVNYVSNKHWFLRYFRLTVVCLACFPQICLSSCWDNDKKLKRSQEKKYSLCWLKLVTRATNALCRDGCDWPSCQTDSHYICLLAC